MGSVQVRLTSRDFAILKDLLSWRVLSLEQLRRRHFANRSQSVSSERITKLHSASLVCKQRVGILIHQGHPKEIGSVVTLTAAGLRIVHANEAVCNNFQQPRPLNTSELHHDLLLVELADALIKKHPSCKIVRGERTTRATNLFERVPDLEMNVSGESWAVELELTTKSSTRYRQILASYQVSSIYDRVLYVVGNTQTAVKIRRLLGDHLATSATPFGSFGRFTITPLQDYFCNPDCIDTLEKITKTKNLGEKLNEK